MDNKLREYNIKGLIALIYAIITYISLFITLITYGTIFPDNFFGWIIFFTGGIIAPILVKRYSNLSDEEEYRIEKEERTEMEQRVQRIPDFDFSQDYLSYDGGTHLLIDETRKKICILEKFSPPKIYSYRDVLKSEILQDGNTITSTNRGSQIGGALLGGILAGGVGAIIGGLSGSQTSTEQLKEINLQIVVNDTKDPVHNIYFLKTTISKPKEQCKEYIDKAQYCHNLISVLIKQADNQDKLEEKKSMDNHQEEQSFSVSDELTKLVDMKKEGVLSEEEFISAKKKLLS